MDTQIIILAAVFTILYFLYNKLKNTYKYWERKGIKGPKPLWFLGNFETVFRKQDSVHSLTSQFYQKYRNEKFFGIYQGLTPSLVITDPELIKKVLIKDFGNFVNRGVKVTAYDPLNSILFFQDGNDWRILRQRLSPLFTSGKLKQMMPILNNCVKEFIKYADNIVEDPNPKEMRNLSMKLTLKTITSIAFGLEIDTFSDEKNIFIEMANSILETNNMKTFIAALKTVFPRFTDLMRLKLTNKNVIEFFTELVQKIVKQRQGKPKVRKDFMDCMIELKEQGTVIKGTEGEQHELEITDTILMAEAVEFYAAGFATTSGTIAYLLYELALNTKIQDRCYGEIKELMEKMNGELTYDSLQSLQYIGMVFDETLRKYPIAGILFRESIGEYKFPDLTIENGTKILIPVTALHKDPNYFPNPEVFDPERFSPENRANIRDCTYLPFGDGPRNCIGLRFAKTQSILGIAHFLYKFRVEPSNKTVDKLLFDPQQAVLTSIDGIWLNIRRRYS